MVFQNYVLIPHWESRKTVGFFLRLRDREEEVPAHVNTVAKITGVDIESLMGRFPREPLRWREAARLHRPRLRPRS